jgi:hypothetical protein
MHNERLAKGGRTMKRTMVAGGLAASGCSTREERVGDDGNGSGRGGAAGVVDLENWGCLDEAPVPPTNALVSLQLEVTDATDRGHLLRAARG